MAVNTSLRHQSLLLYHFLCQHIVGTEETVRIKRMMNTVRDNLSSSETGAVIISGSFGEGLEIKDSDIDLMFVPKQFIVHEKKENVEFDHAKVNLVMEMDDTKPGYTLLRYDNPGDDSALCMEKCPSNESLYLSSDLIKAYLLNTNDFLNKCHGPCLSDENGEMDVALCFHNPNWILPAKNWTRRGNMSWPNSEVKSDIIKHGVLLVPIGCKGSDNEALEWRISFSVAEKLLVYSFCHTQLLCYALMKMLLKDYINSISNCKEILCSYFIKTIIFWVAEETAVNEWKPENLIRCFMRYFKRLVYYVEYSMCPHYFIPTINMFENKIEGESRQLLLAHLKSLLSFGWRCVLFSKQFRHFEINSNVLPTYTEIQQTQLQYLLTSKIIKTVFLIPYSENLQYYSKCILQLNIIKSSLIKSIYLRHLSFTCTQDLVQSNAASPSHTNKNNYSQYRKKQSYLLQGLSHDAGSGWHMFAAFFYNMKQYSKALYLLNQTLMKFTEEKAYYEICLKVNWNKLRILRVLKHSVILPVKFIRNSSMVPDEIALHGSQYYLFQIPPVVLTHFLCVLCHHHLNDRQLCYNSIKYLIRSIDETVLTAKQSEIIHCFQLLVLGLQLVGHNDLEAQAFSNVKPCIV